MNRKLLLVDFENVQPLDLSLLDDNFQILIFVGASQKSVPIELVTSAQKLGARIEWLRVDATGSNALDFFIACQLGRVLETSPKTQCVVLSKDKGYDPLLRYLAKIGLSCRRINSLLELAPNAVDQGALDPNCRRVVELLGKSEKRRGRESERPWRRTSHQSSRASSIRSRSIESSTCCSPNGLSLKQTVQSRTPSRQDRCSVCGS